VAAHRDPVTPVLVIAAGALAAYLGDGAVYALCRRGGEAVTRRLHLSARPVRAAEAVRRRLMRRPVTVLLVSRLVPAGRIPVLLAAALVDLPWKRFLVANAPACALWSASYAAVGVLGRLGVSRAVAGRGRGDRAGPAGDAARVDGPAAARTSGGGGHGVGCRLG
jgi:membrane protein DedA with SNARE-associated domain